LNALFAVIGIDFYPTKDAHAQSSQRNPFRHTYRSWLDETGAPISVQQQLMRHASIQTTMNVYGQGLQKTKRDANRKVVEMALREPTVETKTA
jgi:hypothetical protein